MAKQLEDTVTAELLPMPKKRGRPATGHAMSAAARKRAQRERSTQKLSSDWTVTDCIHLLELPDLTENEYSEAYYQLMRLRGYAP